MGIGHRGSGLLWQSPTISSCSQLHQRRCHTAVRNTSRSGKHTSAGTELAATGPARTAAATPVPGRGNQRTGATPRSTPEEISSHFTGQADGLSRRVKGFQDYLQGALVDLARSVEQLELVPETLAVQPSP